MVEILTKERVVEIRSWCANECGGEHIGDTAPLHHLCDSHESLRAKLAEAEKERDEAIERDSEECHVLREERDAALDDAKWMRGLLTRVLATDGDGESTDDHGAALKLRDYLPADLRAECGKEVAE